MVPVREGEVPVVPTVLFYVALVACSAAFVGRVLTRRYTWVEYAESDRALSRRDVQKLSDALVELRVHEVAGRRPAGALIVAGVKGFEREALELARSLRFECYRRADAGFEKVS